MQHTSRAIGFTVDEQPLPSRWLLMVILIMMSILGLIGSDIYLPALPMIQQQFGVQAHDMQMTIGVYLFGVAAGQLIYGPLIDCYGRRNLLRFGIALYCIASVVCAMSTNLQQMLFARLLQSFGACAGLVIARAIVSDLFKAQDAGKIFATISPFVGMSPAIAPFIGGYIAYYFGWHATFMSVGLFALVLLLLVQWYLPETFTAQQRKSMHIFSIIKHYACLLINRKFICYVVSPCAAYIAYFAYISQSPFIFYAHGYSQKMIGTFYILLSVTYVSGSLLARRLIHYLSVEDVLKYGFYIFVAGGLMLLFTSFFAFSLIAMISAISVLTFGNGFLIPMGMTGAMTNFASRGGYASGLLGFLQLSSAAISSSLIGLISQNNLMRLAGFIFISTIAGYLCFVLFLPKRSLQ